VRAELQSLKQIIAVWAVIFVCYGFFIGTLTVDAIAQDNKMRDLEQTQSVKKKTNKVPKLKKISRKLPKVQTTMQTKSTPSISLASSAGNLYAKRNCTWYAKEKRPDLPNNLGNANTWAQRARNQGIPTGSVPKVGAIGQRGMHVVYVDRVNPDNTVVISEMNYVGLGKISHRTLPANSFTYIY
jgi:surface antigen